ncbi:MAG: hypothetical protein F6K21_14990 [Symploca sp. SIO2D2]|nr:hypothetical protein [Symploca sp. SIO2D2]
MKNSSNSIDLFYSDSSYLLMDDWANIVHSIITYADAIWLDANYSFAKEIDNNDRIRFCSIIRDLREAKIIKTWQFEYNLHSSSSSISRVITSDENRMLHNRISKAIVQDSKKASSNDAYNIQSKFVDARHELLYLGLTSLCKADGVTYNRLKPNKIISTLFSYEDVLKRYTQQLFRQFSIGDLSKLSSSDIIELRSSSKYLRDQVNNQIKNKLLPLQSLDDKIIEDCQKLYTEYEHCLQELIREKQGKNTFVEITKDMMVSGTGLFIPIVSLIPSVEKVLNWMNGRDKRGFLAYMLQAKKMTE